jgi:hypothetical protein
MAVATTISSAQAYATGSRRRTRAFGVLAAVLGALVVWTIEGPILGARMEVPQGGTVEHITWDRVLFVSTLVSLAGWGLIAVLERFVPRYARGIWTVAAVVVLLLSFFQPVLGADITPGTRVGLCIIHITVASILIPVIRRTSKSS